MGVALELISGSLDVGMKRCFYKKENVCPPCVAIELFKIEKAYKVGNFLFESHPLHLN